MERERREKFPSAENILWKMADGLAGAKLEPFRKRLEKCFLFSFLFLFVFFSWCEFWLHLRFTDLSTDMDVRINTLLFLVLFLVYRY